MTTFISSSKLPLPFGGPKREKVGITGTQSHSSYATVSDMSYGKMFVSVAVSLAVEELDVQPATDLEAKVAPAFKPAPRFAHTMEAVFTSATDLVRFYHLIFLSAMQPSFWVVWG